MVALDRVMVLPLISNSAPAPHPLIPRVLPLKPAGSGSVKPTLVAAASALGFVNVNVRVDILFTWTIGGLKALVKMGVGLAAVRDTVELLLLGLVSGGVAAETPAVLLI